MKKEYRIKKSSEIEEVLKNKQTVGNKYFTLYKKENHETNHFRFAVSVGKKLGIAVARNLIKRRIRNIFQANKDSILNYDLFIIAKREVTGLKFEEINEILKELLKQAKVLKVER